MRSHLGPPGTSLVLASLEVLGGGASYHSSISDSANFPVLLSQVLCLILAQQVPNPHTPLQVLSGGASYKPSIADFS